MAQQTVHRLARSAEHLAGAALHRAGALSTELDAALPGFDTARIQTAAGEALLAAAKELRRADEALERQRDHSKWLRKCRDEQAETVCTHLVDLRRVVTGLYRDGKALRLLGLVGKTPREALPLALRARETVHRLLRAASEGLTSGTKGLSLDFRELATELEAEVAALDDILAELVDSRADETHLLVERDRVLARFRERKTGLGALLEGLYVAAGLPGLVDTLRTPDRATPRRGSERPTRRTTAPSPGIETPTERTTTTPPAGERPATRTVEPSPKRESPAARETPPPHPLPFPRPEEARVKAPGDVGVSETNAPESPAAPPAMPTTA